MNNLTDFEKFALDKGISHSVLNDIEKYTIKSMPISYINPTITEERQLNVAQMDVFSRLMIDRIIFLGSEINDYTSNVIQAQLLYLDSVDKEKDIHLYINSPGGIVYGGLAIYDTMQYISPKIETICTGLAASMASVLLCAGTKGMRYALPHSRIMIHQPLGGTHGQATDMEIAVQEIIKLKKELYDIISNHTGQPYEKVYNDCERDHYLTSKEAVEYGMIDEILNSKI